MRRNDRETLVNAALWLAVTALILAVAAVFLTRSPSVESTRESRPSYRIIGGLEEGVGHIIERGYP